MSQKQNTLLEKHHTVADIAQSLSLSEDFVRTLFRDEPGVLKVVRPATRTKRAYVTVRIPESVLQRVYARLRGRRAA